MRYCWLLITPKSLALLTNACMETLHLLLREAKVEIVKFSNIGRISSSGIKNSVANSSASLSASSLDFGGFAICMTICPNSWAIENRILSSGIWLLINITFLFSFVIAETPSIFSVPKSNRTITIPLFSNKVLRLGTGPWNTFKEKRILCAISLGDKSSLGL